MANEKFTVEMFEKKLKENGYTCVAGARRGASRFSDWSDADRERAHKTINKHYGVDASATVASAKPKAASGKKRGRPAKAAAAPTSPPKRRGRPPKAVAAAPKRRGRPPKVAATASTAAPTGTAPAKRRGRPPKNPVAQVAAPRAPKAARSEVAPVDRTVLANRQVEVIQKAMGVLSQCKDLGGTPAEIGLGVRKASEAMACIVEDLYKIGRGQLVLTGPTESKGAHIFEQAVEASRKGNQIPIAPATPLPPISPTS